MPAKRTTAADTNDDKADDSSNVQRAKMNNRRTHIPVRKQQKSTEHFASGQ